MAGFEIKLDKRFRRQAKGVYEKYEFQVGVISDSAYKLPLPASKGLKSFAGGPARKISSKPSGLMISEVSEALRKNTGINFYTKPFTSGKNKDILDFVKSFFDLCAGRTQAKQTENLLQAIVRNPILRGDYGRNSKITAKIKGFNRFMIDTSQLFQAITAKVKVRSVQS
jgi:hypothetical protein